MWIEPWAGLKSLFLVSLRDPERNCRVLQSNKSTVSRDTVGRIVQLSFKERPVQRIEAITNMQFNRDLHWKRSEFLVSLYRIPTVRGMHTFTLPEYTEKSWSRPTKNRSSSTTTNEWIRDGIRIYTNAHSGCIRQTNKHSIDGTISAIIHVARWASIRYLGAQLCWPFMLFCHCHTLRSDIICSFRMYALRCETTFACECVCWSWIACSRACIVCCWMAQIVHIRPKLSWDRERKREWARERERVRERAFPCVCVCVLCVSGQTKVFPTYIFMMLTLHKNGLIVFVCAVLWLNNQSMDGSTFIRCVDGFSCFCFSPSFAWKSISLRTVHTYARPRQNM